LEQVFRQVDADQEAMLIMWERLVNIDSGSLNQTGVSKVADLLQEAFDSLGFETEQVSFEQAGPTLLATRPGVSEEKVILLGHMDTVFAEGEAEKRPFQIREGKAYGPGVLDMKGGIVQMFYACKALVDSSWNQKTIQVILAGDEEVGHQYSIFPEVLRRQCDNSIAVFCCESGRTDGTMITGRKGVGKIHLKVNGRAAHAGNEPEKGASAIMELAHKTISIKELEQRFRTLNINVGVVSGGTADNVVAGEASARIDIRYQDLDEYHQLMEKVQSITAHPTVSGTQTLITSRTAFPPMPTTDAVLQLFERVRQYNNEWGFGDVSQALSGGGADSAHTALLGLPTVCAMGPKGGMNHSPEEFVVVESLFERTKMLAGLIMKCKRLSIDEEVTNQ